MIRRFAFLVVALLVVSCSSAPVETTSGADRARTTLIDFLTLLNTGSYEEAARFYGGEYEALQVFNTQIHPADRVALWSWACENRLLQCLEVRSVELLRQEENTFIFEVEFNHPDGSLFVRGPCCGANETEMPPQSTFEFRVTRDTEGSFVVLDTPPYVP